MWQGCRALLASRMHGAALKCVGRRGHGISRHMRDCLPIVLASPSVGKRLAALQQPIVGGSRRRGRARPRQALPRAWLLAACSTLLLPAALPMRHKESRGELQAGV